jgi:hypothetical protein
VCEVASITLPANSAPSRCSTSNTSPSYAKMMSALRMTTVSSPARSASAFTRGAVVTPIDGLNAPDSVTLRASTEPAELMNPARPV